LKLDINLHNIRPFFLNLYSYGLMMVEMTETGFH